MSTKDDIIRILEEHRGAAVSGAKIAAALGLSRNAVWKAVRALRKLGYPIQAATNSGYSLSSGSDVLSKAGIGRYLKNPEAVSLAVYESVASTNDVARQMALSGAPDGTLIVSNAQTAGRGRLGRRFYSPPDSGLYLSLILRDNINMRDAGLVTAAAAVAVCRAIALVAGIEAQIKWVNDIYIGGRKVCGILTEAAADLESGTLSYAVVGIGVNVYTDAFPDEIRDTAGALARGKRIARNRLAAEIVNALYEIRASQADFIGEYRRRSCLIGRPVAIIGQGAPTPAVALDIDESGGLVVRLGGGEIKTLTAGEVSVRL